MARYRLVANPYGVTFLCKSTIAYEIQEKQRSKWRTLHQYGFFYSLRKAKAKIEWLKRTPHDDRGFEIVEVY